MVRQAAGATDAKLGLDVAPRKDGSLEVTAVGSGLVQEWLKRKRKLGMWGMWGKLGKLGGVARTGRIGRAN